jgi:uncharacterized membrane protein YhfC
VGFLGAHTLEAVIRLLNALLMVAMPLGLGVFLARRSSVGWRLFIVGAVTFIGSQVIHLPFNSWVLRLGIEQLGLSEATQGVPLALLSLLYGLSAGIFEETARFLIYRFWLRDTRSWRQALMVGAGHGGIESILLGGLAAYALLQAVAYREADLSTLVPVEQLELARAQLAAYWTIPWYEVLLGAVERAFALCFHLSASLLVLQVFTRKNGIWLIIAIGWHTLIDGVALFSLNTWGAYVMEALVGVLAVLSVWIIFALRTTEGKRGDMEPHTTPKLQLRNVDLSSEDVSEEHVEDSRYL